MSPRRANKRALLFIFITILLDVIGFGIIIPVLPELIMELTGEGLSRAAVYGGWLLMLYALMQFFCAPVLGNLSDRYGRRPVLLFSLMAFSADYLVMGLAPTLTWLFFGRIMAGIAGATFAPANAYIADVSPPEKRAQNFGLVGAAFGLGFIIGPSVGGLLGQLGPRVPFFAAAGLAMLNMVYGFFVLPETLTEDKRRPFSLKRANPAGTFLQVRRYPLVVGLLGVMFLYQIAHDANPSVWSYYTMEKLGWSERDVGYSLGFLGLMIAIVQGGLIRKVIPRMGEKRVVYAGLVMFALGFLGFALAANSLMIFAAIVPFALGSAAIPALKGIMSNRVPGNAQGELQGAITSLISFTAIVAPLMMTQLFGYFTSADALIYFPGAPFLTAAMMTFMAVLVFMRVIRGASSPAEAGT